MSCRLEIKKTKYFLSIQIYIHGQIKEEEVTSHQYKSEINENKKQFIV